MTKKPAFALLIVIALVSASQGGAQGEEMYEKPPVSYSVQIELKETVTDELTYDSVKSVLEGAVQDVVDDLLFKDEVVLPYGLEGDVAFQNAFRKEAVRVSGGSSLKDFHLAGILFQNRCSYLLSDLLRVFLETAGLVEAADLFATQLGVGYDQT